MAISALQSWLARNRQFAFYCLIGASGATLDFLVFSALTCWSGWHYQVNNVIGYALGTILSFVLNARYNFKTRDRVTLRFASFCFAGFLGWVSSAASLHLLIAWLEVDKYLAKALTVALVVLVQYNFNRLVSFRKTASPPQAAL